MRRPGDDVGRLASLRAHARRTPSSLSSGCTQHRSRGTANRILRRVIGQVFDRRLAVDARQEQRRQQARSPLLERLGGLPVDAAEICIRQRVERRQQLALGGRHPQRLQQKMIETKGQIERRVAEPRALGVEKDRPARAQRECSSG